MRRRTSRDRRTGHGRLPTDGRRFTDPGLPSVTMLRFLLAPREPAQHNVGMIFASDNWAGVSDKVMTAITAVAADQAPAYGGDELTKSVEAKFCDLFEKDVEVHLVATGTAANALAIAAFAAPGGLVFCHRDAHIATDEAGAVAFFGGGLTVSMLDGRGGKLAPDELSTALAPFRSGFVHIGKPVAVSLSQLTEWGLAYRPGEIAPLAEIAREMGLAVHMDGARFAGAAAATGASPADLTWRAGVDVMSFGGTKNGCLIAEAVVFFDPQQARDFGFARQRAGHGLSKNWAAAAQFEAYLDADHWLDLARHANRASARLAAILERTAGASLVFQPDANEVFARLTVETERRLQDAGVVFYRWPGGDPVSDKGKEPDEVTVRLVTSFQTSEDDLDRLADILSDG